MNVCKSLGFVIIYEQAYTNTSLGEKYSETNYVMYHPEYFLLLHWNTFMGNRNSANLYFNLLTQVLNSPDECSGHFLTDYTEKGSKVKLPFERPKKSDSSSWDEFTKEYDEYEKKLFVFRQSNDLYHIWVGNKDGREGLRYSINSLLEQGKFIPWVETPFLWFLTSNDTKEKYDYNEINQQIISTFPKEVRDKLSI
jgi:hypothetical protein